MIYGALFIHLCLTFSNYLVSRSLAYPPLIFTSLWSTILLLLIFSGDFFYAISELTLLIFILGSVAFSIGGLIGLSFKRRVVFATNTPSQWPNKVLDTSILIAVIVFPFYVQQLRGLSAASGGDSFWTGIRSQTSNDLDANSGFGITSYLIAWICFSAQAAWLQSMRSNYHRYKVYLLIALALAYTFLTMTRTSTFVLLLPFIGMSLILGTMKLKKFLIMGISLIALFVVTGLVLGKGANVEDTGAAIAKSMKESCQVYLLGGAVAFDQFVTGPIEAPSGSTLFLFFVKLSNRFGFENQINSAIQEYVLTPHPTNVYTIYFLYYKELGLLGLAVTMCVLGFIFSLLYRMAKSGRPSCIVLYGLGICMLLQSFFGEAFITALSYWLQAGLFTIVLYGVPWLISSIGIEKNRGLARNSVAGELRRD